MTRDPRTEASSRPSESTDSKLSGRDRKRLRARAHELKPLVQVGQKGLSETAMAEIQLGLEKHELIKVRLSPDREERKVEAAAIAANTGAEIIGTVGRVLILYLPEAAD